MIGTSGDIILEVAAAADPRRGAAARRRLEALAGEPARDFAALVPTRQAETREVAAPAWTPTRAAPHALPVSDDPPAKAYRSLGAILLQKAFETLMPHSIGEGASRSASEVWNSMLAQRLADSAAASVFSSSVGGVARAALKDETQSSSRIF